MKIKSALMVLLSLVIISINLPAQDRDDFTIEFITLGNCYLCKVRIEAAINKLEGVTASNWDYSNDVTTVSYDDIVTDAFIIMQAVADTGHDTEWYQAPDAAYDLLRNTCCEYLRTINYLEVEIGYLSLMDIWMPHVSVDDIGAREKVSVYPTMSNGYYSIDLGKLPLSSQYQVHVYSTGGSLVLTQLLGNDSKHQIDLSTSPNGSYLLIISSNNKRKIT